MSILRLRTIHARNPHCLFKYDIEKLGFSSILSKEFNTVCFTETPLTQVRRLVGTIPGRRVALKGYGLVFAKDTLVSRGANPAFYLNAEGTKLRDYLLARFRTDFEGIHSLKKLKRQQAEYYRSIIQYYSLVNIISGNYDFMWEREWRYRGSFPFKYVDVVAIIANDPDSFEEYCEKRLPKEKFRYVQMLPIVSPRWDYEDIVEAMSIKVWNNALSERTPQA